MSCSTEASTSRGPPPTPYPGQSWDVWLDSVHPKNVSKEDDSKGAVAQGSGAPEKRKELNVATMPNAKAPCYGACPAHDDFVLVQCSDCGLLLKPIAYSHHQESKHRRQASSWGGRGSQQARNQNPSDSSNVINASDSSYKDSFLLSPIFRDMDPFVDLSHSTLPEDDFGHSCDSTCPPGCLQATVFPSSSTATPVVVEGEGDKNIFDQLTSKLQAKKAPSARTNRNGPKSSANLLMRSGGRSNSQSLNGKKKTLKARSKGSESTAAPKKTSAREPPQRTYMTGSPMSVDEDGSYVVKRSSAGRLTLTISKAAGNEEPVEDDSTTDALASKKPTLARTPQKNTKSRRKQVLELSPADTDLQQLKETRSRISRSRREAVPGENLEKPLSEASDPGINSGSQSPQQSQVPSEKTSKPSNLIHSIDSTSRGGQRPASAILDHAGLARSFFKSTTHPRTSAQSFYNGRLVGERSSVEGGRGSQPMATFHRRMDGARMAVQLALNPQRAFNPHHSFPTTSAVLEQINNRIRERSAAVERAFAKEWDKNWDDEVEVEEDESSVPALSPKTSYSPLPPNPTPPYMQNGRQESAYQYPDAHVIKNELKQEYESSQGPPPLQFGPAPTAGSLRKLLAKSTAEVIPLSSAKKRAMEFQRQRRKKPPPIAINPNSSSHPVPNYLSHPVSNPGEVHAQIPNSHTTTVNINRIIELQQNRHPISLSDIADQQITYQQIKKEPRVTSAAAWTPQMMSHSSAAAQRLSRAQPMSGPKEIPLEPIDMGEIKQPVLPPITPLTPTGSAVNSPDSRGARSRETVQQAEPETIDILEECMQEIQLPSEQSQAAPINIPLHRPSSGGKVFATPPSTPHQPTPPLSRMGVHAPAPVSFYETVRNTGVQPGFSGHGMHKMSGEVPEEYVLHQQQQQMKRPVAQMSGYYSQPKSRKRAKADRSQPMGAAHGASSSQQQPAIIIPAVLSSSNASQHPATMAGRNVSISHIPTNAGQSAQWSQKSQFRRTGADPFQQSPTGNQPTGTRQIHPGPAAPRTYVTLANNNGPLLLDSSSGKFFAVNAQTVSSNGATAFVLPNKVQNGMVLNRQATGARQQNFRGRTVGNSQQPQLVLMDAGCLQKGMLQPQGSQEGGGSYRLLPSGGHPVHIPGASRPQSGQQQQPQHYHHPGNSNVVIQHHHLPAHGRQISYHGQQAGGNGTVMINGPIHSGNMPGQPAPVLGSPGSQPQATVVHPRQQQQQQQQFFSPVS